MSDIFISYSHADREIVEKLSDHLRVKGYDAVYDKELDPGDRFPDWISDTVRAARVTLVVWSPSSLESPWVNHEASMAVAVNNYVPIVAGELPGSAIPSVYPQMTTCHWSDFVAIEKALSKRRCWPKPQHEQAIHSQMMKYGQSGPMYQNIPVQRTATGRTFFGRLFQSFRAAGSQQIRNPLLGVFHAGRWSHQMPQRSSDFLNYDPETLCQAYQNEVCLPGEQPYAEVFDFAELAANRIEPRIRLEIEPGQFHLSQWNGLGDDVVAAGRAQLLASGKVSDENGSAIRVSDIYVPDGTSQIVLRVQKAVYGDQVRSNLIADFKHRLSGGRDVSLRSLLREEYGSALPPLSDTRLANTLGVAVILFYRDKDVWTPALWPRSSHLAVFEGGWHCSSSGAAEWWTETLVPTFDNLIVGDMIREIDEELRIPKERLLALAPVSLCREFARMGKPQLFFAGLVDMSHEELVASVNEAGRRSEASGQKRESLQTSIYQYPRAVRAKIHKLQRARAKDRHNASYFDANDLFGRTGLTTECVTNLYYAANALPYLTTFGRVT